MKRFDFDVKTQDIFNRYFSFNFGGTWKNWLEISTKDEFIDLCLNNSGLIEIDQILEKIISTKTGSREFALNLKEFLGEYDFKKPPVLCHTSGTTNNNPSALKWFHMSEEIIKKLWVPGMQAIFESSGLSFKSSAIIFVPSRMNFDGIKYYEDNKYISLYSSEFSQRLVLSQIKPKSYLLYPYKDVFNLEVLSYIFMLDDISVISAPAATILKWADIERLKSGIKNYIAKTKKEKKINLENLDIMQMIEKEGLDIGVRKIQEQLSKTISDAVLIFSISSLNEEKWDLIRNFMKWNRGGERFTNLYVASEIGPFASSLPFREFKTSRENKMYVFPLTLPALEYRGSIKLITETEANKGRLLVSRMHNSQPLINIDTDDVITVLGQNSLPVIGGDILRGEFKLKYQIKINNKINKPANPVISAGNFMIFDEFEVKDSQSLFNCINRQLQLKNDSLLLIKSQKNNSKWSLIIPTNKETSVFERDVNKVIFNCPNENKFKNAIRHHIIDVKDFNEKLIDFFEPKENVLQKVRQGIYPKGILKRWPLYVVRSEK
ncbi:MAG: hypothetical protein ACQERB_01175 [Promethearchaeati archaeon]